MSNKGVYEHRLHIGSKIRSHAFQYRDELIVAIKVLIPMSVAGYFWHIRIQPNVRSWPELT
jgi:hypothetical protein